MTKGPPILEAQRRLLVGELSGAATCLALLIALAGATATGILTARWAGSTLDRPIDVERMNPLRHRQAARPMVGATPVHSEARAETRHCPADQEALFLGLRDALRETFGEALECPHMDPSSGDTVQLTSTGLAIYRAHSRVPSFTDGYHRWAVDGRGLVTWDGDSLDPPNS